MLEVYFGSAKLFVSSIYCRQLLVTEQTQQRGIDIAYLSLIQFCNCISNPHTFREILLQERINILSFGHLQPG